MSILITVSREIGSLGSYIATGVAKKLGLRYLDREILHRAAEIAAGYPDHNMIQKLEKKEQMPKLLNRIRTSLASITLAPDVPSATLREHRFMDTIVLTEMKEANLDYENAWNRVSEERYRAQVASQYPSLVEQVLREFAQEGNAIILGRGGQVILKDVPSALHISIVAPKDIRIQRLAERMELDSKIAEKRVIQSDRERSRYLKHFHNVDWHDPTLYDMTINTASISENLATEIICDAAKRLEEEH
jgi:cytidylate kinase